MTRRTYPYHYSDDPELDVSALEFDMSSKSAPIFKPRRGFWTSNAKWQRWRRDNIGESKLLYRYRVKPHRRARVLRITEIEWQGMIPFITEYHDYEALRVDWRAIADRYDAVTLACDPHDASYRTLVRRGPITGAPYKVYSAMWRYFTVWDVPSTVFLRPAFDLMPD